jgi:hypothetical protein
VCIIHIEDAIMLGRSGRSSPEGTSSHQSDGFVALPLERPGRESQSRCRVRSLLESGYGNARAEKTSGAKTGTRHAFASATRTSLHTPSLRDLVERSRRRMAGQKQMLAGE